MALTTLAAFFDPNDLVKTSFTPADSSTARTVLPAITPVPGRAGSITTVDVNTDAAALHAPLAFALARALVPSGGAGALAPEMATALARTLAEPRELGDLISVLDRVALRAGRA